MRPRLYELEMELVSAPKLSSIRVTRISPGGKSVQFRFQSLGDKLTYPNVMYLMMHYAMMN